MLQRAQTSKPVRSGSPVHGQSVFSLRTLAAANLESQPAIWRRPLNSSPRQPANPLRTRTTLSLAKDPLSKSPYEMPANPQRRF